MRQAKRSRGRGGKQGRAGHRIGKRSRGMAMRQHRRVEWGRQPTHLSALHLHYPCLQYSVHEKMHSLPGLTADLHEELCVINVHPCP